MRDRPGGIRGLRAFLREHSGAVEFDVSRYWPGRRLKEIFTGEMTWRELKVFLTHLPHDSATHREVFGEAAGWTPDTHVMANVYDVLVAVNTEKGKKPKPYPRPELPDITSE